MEGMTCVLSQSGTAESAPVITSGLTTADDGALLCENHYHHGFTSSLHFLTPDKPEVGEELPFVVQVSSPGIPHQDVYSNISQIHHVDIRREDLPNCPTVSPYISKLVGGLVRPNPTSGFGELARNC